jgi:halimadienyl-diphosphate synthase
MTSATSDVVEAAQHLVADLLTEPWGRSSASIYETGRLVSLAPWLKGHSDRIRFLLRSQQSNGAWGPFDRAYALVPTLSAAEGLASALTNGNAGESEAAVMSALRKVTRILSRWLPESGEGIRSDHLPDMPGIELIIPSLARALDGVGLPRGMDDTFLNLLQEKITSGELILEKVAHALEVLGPYAASVAGVDQAENGSIGASPAATAAWLSGIGVSASAGVRASARRYLETAVRQHGGPVACALPISIFERSWVLSWLLRAGVPLEVHAELVISIQEAIGPAGAATGGGLPTDADTTAGALYTLALLGETTDVTPLLGYARGDHFCTWQGEQGVSATTNAHVLEALGSHTVNRPQSAGAYEEVIDQTSAWIVSVQRKNGSWSDRWHSSPYYATSCCALALHRFGTSAARSVERALRWTLETQRVDGSWGYWSGTAEETAYAIQMLMLIRAYDQETVSAASRGHQFLLRTTDSTGHAADDPSLWHDKDLYRPVAITRAAVLAARYLIESRPDWPSGGDSAPPYREAV